MGRRDDGAPRRAENGGTPFARFPILSWPSRGCALCRTPFPPRCAGVTGHACTGQRAGEHPDNRTRCPAGEAHLRRGTMNQSLLDLGDETVAEFTMACGEQPQRRMENYGATALSDTELVAMLLQGGGTPAERAVAMASRLIAEAGSMRGLASWVAADYRRIGGIGRIKGSQLVAIAEVSRRMPVCTIIRVAIPRRVRRTSR